MEDFNPCFTCHEENFQAQFDGSNQQTLLVVGLGRPPSLLPPAKSRMFLHPYNQSKLVTTVHRFTWLAYGFSIKNE